LVFQAKHVVSAAHQAQHSASVKLLPGGGCTRDCGEPFKHQPLTTPGAPHVSEGCGMTGVGAGVGLGVGDGVGGTHDVTHASSVWLPPGMHL
jgi:hypothetical protein